MKRKVRKRLNSKEKLLIENISRELLNGLIFEHDLIFIVAKEGADMRAIDHYVRCEICRKKMLISCSAREFEDSDGIIKCQSCMQVGAKKKKNKPMKLRKNRKSSKLWRHDLEASER